MLVQIMNIFRYIIGSPYPLISFPDITAPGPLVHDIVFVFIYHGQHYGRDIGIELRSGTPLYLISYLILRLRVRICTCGCHRIIAVGNTNDPRHFRDRIPHKAVGITRSVISFVV